MMKNEARKNTESPGCGVGLKELVGSPGTVMNLVFRSGRLHNMKKVKKNSEKNNNMAITANKYFSCLKFL